MPDFHIQYAVDNYRFMSYLHGQSNIAGSETLSFLVITEGYENQDNQAVYTKATWSVFSKWNMGRVRLLLNPAFQHGKTTEGLDVRAWYLRTDFSISPLRAWDATLGMEYFSGNGPSETGKTVYRAFDPRHGSGHAHNGSMDYFTSIPAHTKGAGLFNPYLYNQIALTQQTRLNAALHYFSLARHYVHMQNKTDKYLGTELDLCLDYAFNSFSQVSLGYSMMFGSETLALVKGGDASRQARWAYVMLTVKPVLLSAAAR